MTREKIPDITNYRSPRRCTVNYQKIGKERLLDRGGQAVVYEVNLSNKRGPDRIALKEPPQTTETQTRDRDESFLAEAEYWELVDRRERERKRWTGYEHIVGIIDTGDRQPWIAMEYMDGGDLSGILKSNCDGLEIKRALWITECVARGLEVAHKSGIVHLDLKPENILFRTTDQDVWNMPKIGDWGKAQLLTKEAGMVTEPSSPYAAPEEFDSDTYGKPDTLTDVYRLGAVLYTMLTGNQPYSGSRLSMKSAIINSEGPPTLRTQESVPNDVGSLVKRALSAEKSDRFGSITEFRQAIHNLRVAESDAGGLPAEKSQYEKKYYHTYFQNLKNNSVQVVKKTIDDGVWRVDREEGLEMLQELAKELTEIYDLPDYPTVVWGSNVTYQYDNQIITLTNISIVSFLFMFRYHMQTYGKQHYEDSKEDGKGWSLSLFYQADPAAFADAWQQDKIHIMPQYDGEMLATKRGAWEGH